MKITTKEMSYEDVLALPRLKHRNPMKPSRLLGAIVRLVSLPTMWKTHFRYTRERMELVGDQPCLILMNHSSFTDMKLAYAIFWPKRFNIVTNTDGFIGILGPLMRWLGCIPTHKFVSDIQLIRDMEVALKDHGHSVLMYPEASYSFDGTATPLPRKMGVLMKKLGVPVVTVITQGAFFRDPLYNMLQLRKVDVSAHVKCLLTAEEIKEKSVAELDAILDEAFSFDNFAWQRDNKLRIDVPFRADGLERILYKCPHCGTEGQMEGKGTDVTCHHCGKVWHMDEYGQLAATDGETEFPHIPDWYTWERECVRKELEDGTYRLDTDVKIGMQVDHKAVYMVGEGRLTHDTEGFRLTGADGKLDYTQSPVASYSLYADYYWYELGDVISIGTNEVSYFCFPGKEVSVAKARLAAEELYKMKKVRRKVEQKTSL